MNTQIIFKFIVIWFSFQSWWLFCVFSKKVPAKLKSTTTLTTTTTTTCQYADFFYYFFCCDKLDEKWSNQINKCMPFQRITSSPAYFLLYDVNPVEGFNLRRDVYIRMAAFVKSLRRHKNYQNTFLVLPPFYQLYHWNIVTTMRYQSNDINPEEIVFWNHFFDLDSMKSYTTVIDFWEYFDIMRDCFGVKSNLRLDYVFRLKHFESMFSSRKFEEKFEVQAACDRNAVINRGQFISLYRNFSLGEVQCIEFQGSASLLYNLLQQNQKSYNEKVTSIAFLNAETVLHDYWGGPEYWMIRRSMRFNSFLVEVANNFRREVLNSTDAYDATERPKDWRHEMEQRRAKGGNYLCVHLRRADFLQGREETTPTLRSAATQILHKLKALQLRAVFVSSDCTGQEYRSFKSFLSRYHLTRFQPSSSVERDRLKPGGVAIVDQIICSYARYFMGTFESTFTYRIYEEREILGFPSETTFNTLCKSAHDANECSKNSVWPIVY